MRFTVSSTQLSNCLNNLSKVIVNKNSLPILNSFLFEINDCWLTVTVDLQLLETPVQKELQYYIYHSDI